MAATLPPQITHQHPHDVAPKLGEAVGQSRAVRPRLVGRRSGALITFHPVTSRCFLPGKSKSESKPREQAPDCQQWTGRRCQGCCSYTKLLRTQRGSAPTSFADRAAKRRKSSATARGSESNAGVGLVLRGEQVRLPRCSLLNVPPTGAEKVARVRQKVSQKSCWTPRMSGWKRSRAPERARLGLFPCTIGVRGRPEHTANSSKQCASPRVTRCPPPRTHTPPNGKRNHTRQKLNRREDTFIITFFAMYKYY